MRLIDADALLDFIDVGHLRHPSELCFSEIDVANMLLHAPTISPDEVRGVGKWICDPISAVSPVEEWYCNVCKQPAPMGYGKAYVRTNYCPNCGARLTGGEND